MKALGWALAAASLVAAIGAASGQRKPVTGTGAGTEAGRGGVQGAGGGTTGTSYGGAQDIGLHPSIPTGNAPTPQGATGSAEANPEAELDQDIASYIDNRATYLIQTLPIVEKTRRVAG
jgi:hypothetical protein